MVMENEEMELWRELLRIRFLLVSHLFGAKIDFHSLEDFEEFVNRFSGEISGHVFDDQSSLLIFHQYS